MALFHDIAESDGVRRTHHLHSDTPTTTTSGRGAHVTLPPQRLDDLANPTPSVAPARVAFENTFHHLLHKQFQAAAESTLFHSPFLEADNDASSSEPQRRTMKRQRPAKSPPRAYGMRTPLPAAMDSFSAVAWPKLPAAGPSCVRPPQHR